MKPKIVVLDGYTMNPGDLSWSELESLGDVSIYERTTPQEFDARVADASILVTNKVALDEPIMNRLPQLKFITIMATGYNVVDVAAAGQLGIPVSNVPAYSTHSVAQHVFAMLLSYLHAPQQHHQAIQEGEWQRRGDFSFSLVPMSELAGKTFGVIGMGRIGQATANVAAALGMNILAHSRTEYEHLNRPRFRWGTVEEVFSQADVISLHCPLTDQNQEMVDESLLSRMKPSAILINTARGQLVDEPALAEALNRNVLRAALLDVTSSEPIEPNNPLLNAKNCFITPHIAWATLEARQRALNVTIENIRAFLAGQPQNVVS